MIFVTIYPKRFVSNVKTMENKEMVLITTVIKSILRFCPTVRVYDILISSMYIDFYLQVFIHDLKRKARSDFQRPKLGVIMKRDKKALLQEFWQGAAKQLKLCGIWEIDWLCGKLYNLVTDKRLFVGPGDSMINWLWSVINLNSLRKRLHCSTARLYKALQGKLALKLYD